MSGNVLLTESGDERLDKDAISLHSVWNRGLEGNGGRRIRLQYWPLILVDTGKFSPSIKWFTEIHSSNRPKSVSVPSITPEGGNLPEESMTAIDGSQGAGMFHNLGAREEWETSRGGQGGIGRVKNRIRFREQGRGRERERGMNACRTYL